MAKRGRKTRGKAGYMISAVAEMYNIHPQTLRLYEREGLLIPSRSRILLATWASIWRVSKSS